MTASGLKTKHNMEQAMVDAVESELREFSYIVSHDIAARFRHVAEFSRLLLGELSNELTDRQQVHADYINDATMQCQTMMEQLLFYSRLQQHKLETVSFDATPTMRLVLERLKDKGRDAGAAISLEPLGEVHADRDLLAVVFRHLIDNAIKFRRPNTRLMIAVSAAHDEDAWRIRITDNGVGVEPAYREKAFRMFQRLHGQNAHPGVGAGLAICRRVARRHGGDLSFIDSVAGACIQLALPRGGALP